MNDIDDVAIIGGGPAGRTAACLLPNSSRVVFSQKFATLRPRLSLTLPLAAIPSPTATTCVP